jgi:hypothetical protein
MTIGPSREALDNVATVGVAAHIHAAAPGGPRYNAAMSPEERASIERATSVADPVTVSPPTAR